MADWGKILSRGKVEDRRGMRMVGGLGGVSITGIVVLMALSYLTGGNPLEVLTQIPLPTQTQQTDTGQFAGADEYEVFASTVLGSANDFWRQAFASRNLTYREPTLVLFRDAVQSGCGMASSQVGPFYCSLDQTIYLDETFFEELTRRFGARGGDVAQAYVIAHEVGHHAQYALGMMDRADSLAAQRGADANAISVKLELQADCFAGLWAYSIKDRDVFEPGEIAEAMDAAAAVGDDRIQQATQGRVNPESWTHGSSQDRKTWLTKGYDNGTVNACDTFGNRG